MTERTTVEFTQAGKRLTFSAGYLVATAPFKFRGARWDGHYVNLQCAIVTSLGVVFVDQSYEEVMNRWREAMEAPDPTETVRKFPGLRQFQPLGNDAEF